MPVARDTTSAISSAPTSVRRSCGFFASPLRLLVRLVELRLELRQLAVLQLRHLLPVALAPRLFHLELDLVDLLLDVLRAGDIGLFRLPHFVQIRVLALELRDFLLDQRKPLLRCGVGFLFHRLALDLELNQPAVEPVHRLGLGIDLHPDPRGRLVDQVDRLVRQEAVGDVAMRELRRGDDRGVRDLDAVVELVALLEPAQNGDRRLDRRLVDQHLLEAALERGVLLDVFPVFVERRRADAMELAAGERRLQHVAGVDRALGLAGADHRVQLVDEDDRLAGVGGDVLQHGLQALLELAAVLGAGEQGRHVERQHALALQRFRHLAVDDALREPLDDGGLAHARLADQHRIVLGAPLQDLDRPPDLVVPPDHGVELAVAGAFGEVDRVFLQRLALALGLLRVHAAAPTDGLDGALQAPSS